MFEIPLHASITFSLLDMLRYFWALGLQSVDTNVCTYMTVGCSYPLLSRADNWIIAYCARSGGCQYRGIRVLLAESVAAFRAYLAASFAPDPVDDEIGTMVRRTVVLAD